MPLAIYLTVVLIIIGAFFYSWYRIHEVICTYNKESKKTPKDYGLSYETRYITTTDGLNLSTWYIPAKNPKAFIILIHGYAQLDGGRPLVLFNAEFLHHAGYTTFLVNLRATGESEGKKSTFGVSEWRDVEAAYDYIKTLPESKGKKIGLYGASMGAATVIITAGHTQKGDFVVAGAPYASFKKLYSYRLQQEKLPRLLLPFLLLATYIELSYESRYFIPENLISKIHVPLFITSSKHDKTVNCQDAIDLFEKANQPKVLWEADSGHLVDKDQPEELKKRVLAFLDKYVIG
jgi:dipeptidyl aminopeptidase/acylaminoacyl peptidase